MGYWGRHAFGEYERGRREAKVESLGLEVTPQDVECQKGLRFWVQWDVAVAVLGVQDAHVVVWLDGVLEGAEVLAAEVKVFDVRVQEAIVYDETEFVGLMRLGNDPGSAAEGWAGAWVGEDLPELVLAELGLEVHGEKVDDGGIGDGS